MKQFADRRRSEREFSVGDQVYLKLRPPHQRAITHRLVSKLSPNFFGPFPIVAKFGTAAYKLQPPANSHIHPAFHVSLLKKSAGTQPVEPTLPAYISYASPPVEPALILDKWVIHKQGAPITQVLVQWAHLHLDNTTWEYLPKLLQQYPRVANLL